jgi:hypothetical protein
LEPAIAFDGVNYLVAWSERAQSGRSDIAFVRVDRTGVVLSPGVRILTGGSVGGVQPAIAFDGTNYLVVWTTADWRNRISGRRITPLGDVLDAVPLAVSSGPLEAFDQSPSLAFDGTNFLVVWNRRYGIDNCYGSYTAFEVWGARVSAGGAVVDTTGFPISNTPGHQRDPRVAFDGTRYLVVWSDSRAVLGAMGCYWGTGGGIRGARVAPSGQVADPTGVDFSSGMPWSLYSPALDFDGTNFLVVWEDQRAPAAERSIYGARISTQGSVLEPQGFAISRSAGHHRTPTVTHNNVGFLVAWFAQASGVETLQATPVSASGVLSGNSDISVASTPQPAGGWSMAAWGALASDGNRVVAVWPQATTTDTDIFEAILDSSGRLFILPAP